MQRTLLLGLIALVLGTGAAMAEQKIAVVDVPAVVAKSAQVQALKKEQQAKIQDLEKWLKTAQAKAKGYNMVISKDVVIYGGDDITADVQKAVK